MFYAVAVAVALYVLYSAAVAIYNVFFHPLSYIPGPKLWIAFPILSHFSHLRGRLDIEIRALHRQHGEILRFGPDEVSFITAQAWKDIYGHGHRQMPKVETSSRNPLDIISANDVDHTRYRKALSHAFSAKGLQAQEPILMEYIDKLIERMREAAESQDPVVDLVKWYNLTTFDLIGDLAFGESFGGLDSSEYHHWVATIFQSIRALAYIKLKDVYPLFFLILAPFFPKGIVHARNRQREHSSMTVQKRLKQGPRSGERGAADFMQSMLRHRGEKDGLLDEELEANADIIIIAGSETTATLLSGVTFFLLQTPEAMEKVTQEVRSTMQTEDEITFQNVTTKLPYLLACLDEALRMYPPVPSGLQRLTPSTPVEISGYRIAPNTKVAVHQSAASSSALNFHKPDQFIPERWLAQVKDDPSSPFHKDNRDVVQPFSTGPRNCIGKNLAYNEMRVILARMLWNFDLELCEESTKWNQQRAFVLWEKPPLMCKLKSRDVRV